MSDMTNNCKEKDHPLPSQVPPGRRSVLGISNQFDSTSSLLNKCIIIFSCNIECLTDEYILKYNINVHIIGPGFSSSD